MKELDNETVINIHESEESAGKKIQMVRTCHEKVKRKRVSRMDVEGRRRKGRLKLRWIDILNVDLREKGLPGRRPKTRLCGCN